MALLHLKPTSDVVASMGSSPGPTLYGAVDEPWNAPDDTDFIVTGNTVVLGNCLLGFESLPSSTPMVVNSVKFVYRQYNPAPGAAAPGREFRARVRSGGTDYYGTLYGFDSTNVTAYYTETYLLDPKTGLTWTTAGVNAFRCGIDEPNWYPVHGAGSGSDPRYSHMYLEVDYTPKADQIESTREDGSRRLLIRERGRGLVELDAPPLFLDAELGTIIYVTDPLYVDSTGAVLGIHTWERRPLRVLSVEADPASYRARLICRDLRDGIQLRRLWDTMVADNAGPFAEGVARLGCGGVRTFTRASRAYPQDRSDQLIRQSEQDFEAFDRNGELFESARTNVVLNSNFSLGSTSWTLTNATVDTTRLAWDSDVTTNSVRLAATGVAVGSLAPSAAYGAAALTGKRTISIGALTQDGLGIIILRSGGGLQYWNASTQSWQAGTVTNVLTAASATYEGQDRLAITYDLGAGAYSVTPTIVTNGTAVTAAASVFDVQDEAGTWPTSHIMTTSAAVARAVTKLAITLPDADRSCWPDAHGQAYIEVTPEWSAADRATGAGIVLSLVYDANNSVKLQWNGASARWEFVRVAGGVSTTAYKAASPVRGTKTKLLIQWTGTDAELGLAAYTQRIYVDGVQGTDVTAAGAPTAAYPATLYVGSDSTPANHIDAVLSSLIVTDFVSPAAEVARFPLP